MHFKKNLTVLSLFAVIVAPVCGQTVTVTECGAGPSVVGITSSGPSITGPTNVATPSEALPSTGTIVVDTSMIPIVGGSTDIGGTTPSPTSSTTDVVVSGSSSAITLTLSEGSTTDTIPSATLVPVTTSTHAAGAAAKSMIVGIGGLFLLAGMGGVN